MSKIEIEARKERWLKGVDIEATIKEINDYIKFKIIKYTYYNF
jgi:hypothetical protein